MFLLPSPCLEPTIPSESPLPRPGVALRRRRFELENLLSARAVSQDRPIPSVLPEALGPAGCHQGVNALVRLSPLFNRHVRPPHRSSVPALSGTSSPSSAPSVCAPRHPGGAPRYRPGSNPPEPPAAPPAHPQSHPEPARSPSGLEPCLSPSPRPSLRSAALFISSIGAPPLHLEPRSLSTGHYRTPLSPWQECTMWASALAALSGAGVL